MSKFNEYARKANAYCFERCMNNTAMIDKWDELTGAAIERF